jgi:hypothetical protein
MDDLSRFCCQNPKCEAHGRRGSGNLYVLEHLDEGCGVRQTARLTKVNRKAVGLLSKKAGGPGKRTAENCRELVKQVHQRMGGKVPRLITTDEYPSYPVAIHQVYGRRVVPLTVLPKRSGRPRGEKKVVPRAFWFRISGFPPPGVEIFPNIHYHSPEP